MWYNRDNKKPIFFLACGPMSEAYCPYVFNVILKVQELGLKAFFVDQRNVLNPSNSCCGHPSADADLTLAEVTTSTIAGVMGWSYL